MADKSSRRESSRGVTLVGSPGAGPGGGAIVVGPSSGGIPFQSAFPQGGGLTITEPATLATPVTVNPSAPIPRMGAGGILAASGVNRPAGRSGGVNRGRNGGPTTIGVPGGQGGSSNVGMS